MTALQSQQRSTNLYVLDHDDAGHYGDVLSPVGRVRLEQTEQVSSLTSVWRRERGRSLTRMVSDAKWPSLIIRLPVSSSLTMAAELAWTSASKAWCFCSFPCGNHKIGSQWYQLALLIKVQ